MAISKLEIWICFPRRFVEGRGEGDIDFPYLLSSIYCFSWSKISFKLFFQAFFCLSLTCAHNIYCISVHWSWNLSSGVIANFQCGVSKPDIWIFFPHIFLGGCGEGAGVLVSPISINTLIGFKSVPKLIQVLSCVGKCRPKGNNDPLG